MTSTAPSSAARPAPSSEWAATVGLDLDTTGYTYTAAARRWAFLLADASRSFIATKTVAELREIVLDMTGRPTEFTKKDDIIMDVQELAKQIVTVTAADNARLRPGRVARSWIASNDRKVMVARRAIEELTESLAKDPEHALSWSHSAFEAAATISIREDLGKHYRTLEATDGAEAAAREIREHVFARLLRGDGTVSTSPTNNLITAARAEVIRKIAAELAELDR